jgi:hypothetical protein
MTAAGNDARQLNIACGEPASYGPVGNWPYLAAADVSTYNWDKEAS